MKRDTVSRFLIIIILAALCAAGATSCGGDVTLENMRVVPTANIVVTDTLVPLDDHALPFGTVYQGTVSDQTVIIANTGTADLVIGTIAAANPLASPFSITSDACSGQTIAAAGSCSLAVRFAPSAAGSFNDGFDIPSNAQNAAVVTLSVSGIGSASPVPNIAVTDPVAPAYDHQVPFGSVVGGTTSDRTVTVTNTGSANLVIGTVGGTDPAALPFSILADTCSGQTLTPPFSCTLTIRFAPVAAGSYSDSFSIPSDDPDTASITVSVSGTGSVPNIVVTDSVSPTNDHQVPFGSVAEGYTSSQTVTVRNSGTANLVIGTVAGTDLLTAPFSITANTCTGQTIAPAGTCSLTVRFAPAAISSYSDSFDIPSNDPDTPSVTVSVTGTGTPPVPDIEVTDTVSPFTDRQAPFGEVAPSNTSSQTVTVTNSGTANLVIGAMPGTNPLAAPFSITANTCASQTLAPSGTCTITVQFAPTALGSYSDSFNIPSNDPDTPSVTVSVSGTGGAPADLPETGQTTCYDGAGNAISCTNSGQDGELRKGVAWPTPRFTAGTGSTAACITDNLTGLMWPKSGNLSSGTWQQALDYVAININSGGGLCGYADWRLPNKNELRSLAHYGQTSTAAWLNTQGFTNVQPLIYWSSTSYIHGGGPATYAWAVNMSDGGLYGNSKANSSVVWPVRAGTSTAPAPVPQTGQTICYNAAGASISCANTGQDGELRAGVAWPAMRFTTNTSPSGTTITDNLTGLTWTPAADTPTVAGSPTCGGGFQYWQNALDYVDCLNTNSHLGHADWRLPNVNELRSLSNDGESNMAAWLQGWGFSNLQLHYWTADSYISSPSNGWEVDLAGDILPSLKTAFNFYVWPVRGGL